jgi:hypothetical protein
MRLFVEYTWGKPDGLTYVNTGKENVKNLRPVISEEGVFRTPAVNQCRKRGLFLNTLRSVVDDNAKWFSLLHDYYQHFRYRTIMTTDMEAFFNQQTGMNLMPIFNEYLRYAQIPFLLLRFDPATHPVSYRWQADASDFAMPVEVGQKDLWQLISPTTTEW